MEYFVFGGFLLLIFSFWPSDPDKSISQIPYFLNVIEGLLREETKLTFSVLDPDEAFVLAANIFGSQYEYKDLKAVHVQFYSGLLFYIEANVSARVNADFKHDDEPVQDNIVHNFGRLFYEDNLDCFSFGADFKGPLVKHVLLNKKLVSDFKELRGSLGSLRGLALRTILKTQR